VCHCCYRDRAQEGSKTFAGMAGVVAEFEKKRLDLPMCGLDWLICGLDWLISGLDWLILTDLLGRQDGGGPCATAATATAPRRATQLGLPRV